jgi:hypothetical protein
MLTLAERPSLALLSIVCGAAILSGCDAFVGCEAAANVEKAHREALIAGYSGFELLDWSTDVGADTFGYKPPPGFGHGKVLETIRAQIVASDGCFRETLRSDREVQLRCPYSGGGFAEYRVRSHDAYVVVMFGDFDSPDEWLAIHSSRNRSSCHQTARSPEVRAAQQGDEADQKPGKLRSFAAYPCVRPTSRESAGAKLALQ